MSRPTRWLAAAVAGAAATLMTSFGLPAVVVVLLLALLLLARADRAVAVSGLLVGFGACWSVVVAPQFASGSTPDSTPFWATVGIVPLVAGGALSLLIGVRAAERSDARGRT